MYTLIAILAFLTATVFSYGLVIAFCEGWEWRNKCHEWTTIGCAIGAVIFSTILNIIS